MKFPIITVLAAILTVAAFLPAVAQNEPDYVLSYRNGNNKAAIDQAKAATRRNSRDGKAWYYLGLAHSSVEDYKNATNALQKARDILPSDANVHAALAWTLFKTGHRFNAIENARKATVLDPQNARAYHVLSVASLPDQNYSAAYHNATSAISADPELWVAYQIRAFALIGSFAKQVFTVVKPQSSRTDLLKEAARDLETFLEHSPNVDHGHFGKQYLEGLKYFSENYQTPDQMRAANALPNRSPYRMVSMPKATYSSQARRARIEGEVRLLVQLRHDGQVGHILLLTPIGYGLDEQAMKAASKLRFEPARVDGKPVSTVVTIDYSFNFF